MPAVNHRLVAVRYDQTLRRSAIRVVLAGGLCILPILVGVLRGSSPAGTEETDAKQAAAWRQATVSNESRNWWAFLPLANVEPPPAVESAPADSRGQTPVDRFVFGRQAEKGVSPNPPADRRTLGRRAYLILTGLPPSPQEINAFVEDDAPDAYDRLVDKLLASPHFGERWARHWLDVARFAESFGFEQDYDRPHAYHYRDFVIKAFNDDMPFDQFIRWQLAGDELAPDNPLAWMATGFLGAGAFPTQLTEVEFESARYDELDDMVSTTSMAFLALTVGCARCHEHKYDPIPQADYYRLASTFTTAIRSNVEFDLRSDAEQAKAAPFEKAHAALVAELETVKGTPEEKKLAELVAAHEKLRPSGPTKATVVSENVPPIPHNADDRGFPHFYPETHFLIRGEVAAKDGAAEQGFLQVLIRNVDGPAHWQAGPPDGSKTSHRRAALARWITDTEYGAGHLAARVIVNRLWQHYFGRGIVETPNDFGKQGAPPTDPALLDWLAGELIRNDWHLKPIHRLLATSAVFTQSSELDDADAAIDPTNEHLWRFRVRRLEGEAIRDSMLAACGLLDRRMFGPGTLDETTPRRSIYFFVKRSRPIPSMVLFDAPEPLVSQGRRPTTTTGPGALWFLNNKIVKRSAEALADRMLEVGDEVPSATVRRGFLLALCREPTAAELANALDYIEQQTASYKQTAADETTANPRRMAIIDLGQVLLSLNEFVYLE